MPCRHKSLRHFGIAKLGDVKVNHRNVGTVFHFGLTKIVQMFVPVAKLFQVFRHMLGNQNVLGITTIHHPLGNVDAGAGDVGASAHIHHTTNRAAVNTHPQFEFGMFFDRAANFQRTFHRRFRCVVKNQGHPIPSRNRNQPMVSFRFAELFGATDDLVQCLEQTPLLID